MVKENRSSKCSIVPPMVGASMAVLLILQPATVLLISDGGRNRAICMPRGLIRRIQV